jgi:hypothetical protein
MHWARPEVVAEVTYLTWTEDNLLREGAARGQAGQAGRSRSGRAQRELHSARTWSDAMSCTTISKPLSVDHLHRLKQRWQRGLAVEHALIVLLIAFSAFQFLFGVGATVG